MKRFCAGIRAAFRDSRGHWAPRFRDTEGTRSTNGCSARRLTTRNEPSPSRMRLFETVPSHTPASAANCSSVANACIQASGHYGSSTKAAIPLELPEIMTDVERPFASHRSASSIGPGGSRNWSLPLGRRRSQHMEAPLPLLRPRQSLRRCPQLSMACRQSRLSISHIVPRRCLNANTLTRPRPHFAEALEGLFHELKRWGVLHPAALASHYFPNDPLTIVPLALALSAIADSAQVAILLAANTGGDSDSVASIAGGIAAARYPDSVHAEWSAAVDAVNHHDLVSVAEALTALRR